MHFSKEKLKAEKPVVAIRLATIHRVPGTTTKNLKGYPINHPRERLNDKHMESSTILSVEGNRVETRNTIYDVISWDKHGK